MIECQGLQHTKNQHLYGKLMLIIKVFKMFQCITRQDSKSYKKVIRKKLVIVGDGECGKTCLLHRFVRNEFNENGYLPTVFESDIVEVMNGKTHVDLLLYDTAGQECYDRLRPIFYPDTDIVLITFSIDNPDSLINVVSNWAPEIRHFCCKTPVILVGTKSDIRDELCDNETVSTGFIKQGPVKYKDAVKVANEIGAVKYLECSAKTNVGVETLFKEAVKNCFIKKSKRRKPILKS